MELVKKEEKKKVTVLVPDDQAPGFEMLVVGSAVRSCPFQPPLIMQEQAPTGMFLKKEDHRPPIIRYRSCGSWCALFHHTPSDNSVMLFCGGTSGIRVQLDPKEDTGIPAKDPALIPAD